MKKSLLMVSMLISSLAFSQVGIHTSNPQGSFNVDGAKDNPTTGIPNAAQQSNDLTVLNTGNVGIGTNAPVGKLHLYNPATGSEMGNDYVIDDESPVSQIQGLVMRRSAAGNNLAQNDFIGAMLFNPKIGGTFGYAGAGMAGIYRGNGTTALTALALRVNSNQEAVRIDENANVGIGTSTPSERLDVAGNARVRTITPVTGPTFVTPVYSDANGVLVKASPSATFGGVISNSVNVASGGTGTLITNMTDGAIYKALVSIGDACGNVAIAEYLIINIAANTNFAIKGSDGLLSRVPTKAPTFTETNQTTTAVTWTNKPGCAGGDDPTSFNYTLTMPAAGTINVTNNGNITKGYNITLTRLN
ncbi:hypothetical protein GCM10022217_11140 [Chryseobacterium ginsenosidimutans]|uniref:hypothetical protein n=1 Tax=Chryseobacterium ginsenosidimutans TaxID=687846 RepID=UPI0031DD6E75